MADAEKKPEKRKLTKKEKEKMEKELRRSLPPLSQLGRNGVFEIIGPLSFTWAAGNVPGGPFVPMSIVCRGHKLYVFEGGEAGHAPSAKPRAFFDIKRAEVVKIGLLLIPPLPPHNNVFKVGFAKKQFGHKAFFFKVRAGRAPPAARARPARGSPAGGAAHIFFGRTGRAARRRRRTRRWSGG